MCQGGLDCKPSSETANKLIVMVSWWLELEPPGTDEVTTYVLTGMAEVQSVIYRDDIWGLMKLVSVNQTLTQRWTAAISQEHDSVQVGKVNWVLLWASSLVGPRPTRPGGQQLELPP